MAKLPKRGSPEYNEAMRVYMRAWRLEKKRKLGLPDTDRRIKLHPNSPPPIPNSKLSKADPKLYHAMHSRRHRWIKKFGKGKGGDAE
jgi:hypothetical protein